MYSKLSNVIGVAAFVACAGAISGDNLQDLKTGYLLGATPWRQQIGQIVVIAAGAVAIPLVLNLLSEQILNGELADPQAVLMSSINTGILEGGMDWAMVFMGAGIAFCLIALRHAEKYINMTSLNALRDIYWFDSTGKKYRSRPELRKFFRKIT